ncbi:hypothetical protein BJX63DRAFT_435361 [Aspergillus granulosus]|uniref:Nephrocystin 3-like N-terminal domain-containing protein n=1 Tax=Aspergillus granulosus TaxID=176169 RepID=A0ABR4H188_9EURO
MDPLSALSVAAAVVQFIEFGGKLVNTYCEVRIAAKGQPAEVVSLAANASDLSSVASTAQAKLKSLGSTYPRHAESLLRLTDEVANIQSKIESAMAKLTVNPKKYLTHSGTRALVAIRTVWSQAELDQWNRQLDRIRDQVMMSVLMCVWDEARKVDTRAEHILQAVERIEKTIDARSTLSEGERLQAASQEMMHEAIWASTGLSDSKAKSLDGPGQRFAPTPVRTSNEGLKSFETEILRSLKYDEIKNRSSGIKAAFPDTFQWIFKDSQHSFRRWLISQDKTIFWITGVPASGKSTLMKFIIEHPKLKDLLRIWAHHDDFYVAKFYFWNPGSKIQKSRVGLLRSLLYQLLYEEPDLVEIVASRRQLYFSIAGINARSPEWEWEELCECLVSLISQLHSEGSRIILFIDGLDEYEDFAEDDLESLRTTDEMVEFLLGLHKEYDVKLCVSSRPLNYFRDKFKGCPSLAMQHLTQPDIDHYIEVRLGSSDAIQEIKSLEEDAVEQLIFDLKSKAQGVFLWVVLVVEQLLLTCRDEPHMKAVRRVFDSLPEGLARLYDAIQQQTGPERQVGTSKLYQLLMEWKRFSKDQMESTFLWLAALYDVNQPQYPTPEKELLMVKLTKRLVEGHTRGILQVMSPVAYGKPATIDFLHKTAYEWIQQPENWRRILASGPPDYRPDFALLAVIASHINSPSCLFHGVNLYRIVMWAAYLPDNSDARAQLVSIIDKIDQKHLRFKASSSVPIQNAEQRLLWAAAWACHAYVQGKMDLSSAISPATNEHRFFFSRRKTQDVDIKTPLLEVAIFDVDQYGSGPLNAWLATQRLKTIKVLLRRGARIERYMLERLKKLQGTGGGLSQYAELLLAIAKDRYVLANFDAKVEAAYPKTVVSQDLAEILSKI